MAIVKPRRREGLVNAFKFPPHERLRREVRDVFREQRQAILAYLKAGQKSDTLHFKEQDEPGGGWIPWAWPTWEQFKLGALAISKRMTPILSATWDWAANRFAPRVGLDPDEWSVVNPHTVHKISRAAFDFCDATNESTSMDLDKALILLKEELAEGIIDKGEALPALTKRVNQIFDKAEKFRARRIAQTETSRAVHAAQEQAAIESGVVVGWRWLASPDACDICVQIAADAPVVKLGQPFAIVGNNPTYQVIKYPPAHPNCNCAVTEVLDTDPQPQLHSTLIQPEGATSEQQYDRVYASEMDRINDIQRTWDPATGLYGSGPQRVSLKPLPPKQPIPKFGEYDGPEVKVPYRTNTADLNKSVKKLLGDKATLTDVASIAGAQDNCTVTVSPGSGSYGPTIYVEADSDEYKSYRTIRLDKDLKPYMTANSFYVEERLRGQGIIGPNVMGRMVEQSVRMGLDRIETTAERGRRPEDENGYYTWPRFGYDADLPALLAERPESLASAKRVSDLMSTEEGRQWWKKNGRTMRLTFDLKPGV